MREPDYAFLHRTRFVEDIHKATNDQNEKYDIDTIVDAFNGCLQNGNETLWISVLLLKGVRHRDRLSMSPLINFCTAMRMPRLSRVVCLRGRVVSAPAFVTTKERSFTDSLLYSPAGRIQVHMAARMVTIINMLMGAGKDLLLAGRELEIVLVSPFPARLAGLSCLLFWFCSKAGGLMG